MSKLTDTLGIRNQNEITIDSETGEVLEPSQVTSLVELPDEIDPHLQEMQDDYTKVRNSLFDILDTARSVFDRAALVAESSETPDAISAFGKIMDSMVKANKEVMNVHRDMIAAKPPAPVVESPREVHNTQIVFSGTGADFLEFLKNKTQKSLTDQSE